jgi:hypothetical protein
VGRRRVLLAIVAFAALLATACSDKNEGAAPSPTRLPTAGPSLTPSPSPAPALEAESVAYIDGSDLWIYETGANTKRRLVAGGEAFVAQPGYRDTSGVTYLRDGRLFEIDADGGAPRRLLPGTGDIQTYAWRSGGQVLAYLLIEREAPVLRSHDFQTGRERVLRRFKEIVGREGITEDDEIRLTWSGDGAFLLFTDTALDPQPSLYVMTPDGRNLVPARSGTWARWLNPSTILYREFGGARRWFTLDLELGGRQRLGIRPGTLNPAVSPDGTLVAYDDQNAEERRLPSIFLFDLDAGRERRLAAGAWPQWLSPSEVAFTKVRKCTEQDIGGECAEFGPFFVATGVTNAVDVSSGDVRRPAMSSTAEAAVFIPAAA